MIGNAGIPMPPSVARSIERQRTAAEKKEMLN